MQQTASATTVIESGLGFDSCQDPTVSQMQAWWTDTPYVFWGTYVGGDEMECSQPNLSSNWVASVTDGPHQNWNLLPIWVGPQAPCTSFVYTFSYNTSTAYSQGESQASEAYDEVYFTLGMGSDLPIAYDLESFDTSDGSCVAAAQAFINGWSHFLSGSPPQQSGVYGSSCGSDLVAFATISLPPNFIDGADWDGNSDTSVLACVPSGDWVHSRRFKQYVGQHYQTVNGVRLYVDTDSADGPVYSSPPS
jgi:hypothetical protein